MSSQRQNLSIRRWGFKRALGIISEREIGECVVGKGFAAYPKNSKNPPLAPHFSSITKIGTSVNDGSYSVARPRKAGRLEFEGVVLKVTITI